MKKVSMNKFCKMDCLDYMRLLSDDCVDMVITDPPYGVDFAGSKFYNDSRKYVNEKLNVWINEMHRVAKAGSYLYMFAPTKEVDMFVAAVKSRFNFINLLTAPTKVNCMRSRCTYKYDSQLVIVASKGKAKKLNEVNIQEKSRAWLNDKRNQDDNPYSYHYSSILPTRANSEIKNHPNAKNVELIKQFILLATQAGDVVLDPFAGGKSTAKACKATNRNYYTCDLVDYVEFPVRKRQRAFDDIVA